MNLICPAFFIPRTAHSAHCTQLPVCHYFVGSFNEFMTISHCDCECECIDKHRSSHADQQTNVGKMWRIFHFTIWLQTVSIEHEHRPLIRTIYAMVAFNGIRFDIFTSIILRKNAKFEQNLKHVDDSSLWRCYFRPQMLHRKPILLWRLIDVGISLWIQVNSSYQNLCGNRGGNTVGIKLSHLHIWKKACESGKIRKNVSWSVLT